MKNLISLIYLSAIFLLLTFFIYSCSVSSKLAGRSYLTGTELEEENYGMYSYVLFANPPNEHNRERYLATIRSYLDFDPIEGIRNYKPKISLNIVYLPLEDGASNVDHPDSVLANYNYSRASIILNTLPESYVNRGGPYLVSSLNSLTKENKISEPYVIQDLSSVPPNVIQLWVDEFLEESSGERLWNERALRRLVLHTRTNISIAAEAWPDVEVAVSQFISFFSLKSLK